MTLGRFPVNALNEGRQCRPGFIVKVMVVLHGQGMTQINWSVESKSEFRYSAHQVPREMLPLATR